MGSEPTTILRCAEGALAAPEGRSRVEGALVTVAYALGSAPATWAVDVSSGAVRVPGCTLGEINRALAGQATARALFDFADAASPAMSS